jgi:hypothetical protein
MSVAVALSWAHDVQPRGMARPTNPSNKIAVRTGSRLLNTNLNFKASGILERCKGQSESTSVGPLTGA